MDGNVRLLISRAINSGLIERCNGVVKEGKEAILYHADRGEESGGFDVAVKVFKRIQDFKGRGDYVDGDPRYFRESFRRLSGREQLELWTEKEFRNLTRASRAGVPVPSPLYHKENVLFMRFLGTEGWPAPQLREIDLRHGSKKWGVLYTQVMEAVRKYVPMKRRC
jgi:RIO kinase 1